MDQIFGPVGNTEEAVEVLALPDFTCIQEALPAHFYEVMPGFFLEL